MASRNARKRAELRPVRPTIEPDRGPGPDDENADWIKAGGRDIMTPNPKITPGSSGFDPTAAFYAAQAEKDHPTNKPRPTPKYKVRQTNGSRTN